MLTVFRRLAIVIVTLLACGTVGAGTTAAPATDAPASSPATAKPNFVLFIADDLSWHDIGPYGSTDVRTPNLDKLAKESLKFDRAFAASPTCTPSRSSLFSGLYPMRSGAHANHSPIKPGVRTLPAYLKELGYRVVIAGKTHFGPREQFPFEYLKGSNVMPPGKSELLWTDLSTAKVDELLAGHDKSVPLCLIVCAHSPHVYWMDNQGYDPKQVKLPPYLADTPATRRVRCKYYTDVSHMDEQVGDVLASLEKHGFAKEQTLFAFTADQGAQWPFGKWNLYDAGIRTPLLVRWAGRVKPGSTTGAMVSLVDVLPTLIDLAGGAAPKEIDGQSFAPVLLGKSDRLHDAVYAAHTGDGKMNRSPMRMARTERFKYIHNLNPGEIYKTHIDAAQGRDGKDYWSSWERFAKTEPAVAALIDRYQHRPAEELYDVEHDPYELRNLAPDPAYAATLKELRDKTDHWRVVQGDPLDKVPMPEDGPQGTFPYAE
jgi:arylsulfatase A-like enzyme